jgi:hypothetical protein
MKIRIKKDRIEFWRDVSMKSKPVSNWKVTTIYFNPVEQLRQFIWCQIDEAFRKYAENGQPPSPSQF